MTTTTHNQLKNDIWSVCNLLRGPYKRNEYRKVILPLTVLRRFDCILELTKEKVLAEYKSIRSKPEKVIRSKLQSITERQFYNLSKLNFVKLLDDPNQIASNLNSYINAFSSNVRAIMDQFRFEEQITKMTEKNLLYQVIQKFSTLDLSPKRVDNMQMGYIFEELIRIGAEQSNEEAGEHFTPREVIKLIVNLLLSSEKDLAKSHVVKTIYDPACGTGGWILENDWLEAIVALPEQLFYNTGIGTYIWILSNRKPKHRKEKVQLINATGFFQKMRKALGEKRNELSQENIESITKIFGQFFENEISKIFNNEEFMYRRITIERPLKLSFQVTPERIENLKQEKNFIRLITNLEKSKGIKLHDAIIAALNKFNSKHIWKCRDEFLEEFNKVLQSVNRSLPQPIKKSIISAFSQIDDQAKTCMNHDGHPEADKNKTDFENVPFKENTLIYFNREVKPYFSDAWIVEDKTRIGTEILFTRYFYKVQLPEPLEKIENEIKALEKEIATMLEEVVR